MKRSNSATSHWEAFSGDLKSDLEQITENRVIQSKHVQYRKFTDAEIYDSHGRHLKDAFSFSDAQDSDDTTLQIGHVTPPRPV